MYQAVVMEDDAQAASIIADRVAQSPYASELTVTEVTSPQELGTLVADAGRPDILFADIKMSDGEANGIQAVRRFIPFGCGTQVIYITGYAEYCVPVYETEHVYFLLKPVDQPTFNKALKRAVENLRTRQEKMLPISFRNQTAFVPLEDILFIESKLRKVVVHTADETFETYATLAEMTEALPASFARCHKSFLVNMDAIRKLDTDKLVMTSGATVPIGQRYKSQMKENLAVYYGTPVGGGESSSSRPPRMKG